MSTENAHSDQQPIFTSVVESAEPIPPSELIHGLALLTRWALRKAHKRHQGAEEEVSVAVTGAFTKGPGPHEATQLTCYGQTKG